MLISCGKILDRRSINHGEMKECRHHSLILESERERKREGEKDIKCIVRRHLHLIIYIIAQVNDLILQTFLQIELNETLHNPSRYLSNY